MKRRKNAVDPDTALRWSKPSVLRKSLGIIDISRDDHVEAAHDDGFLEPDPRLATIRSKLYENLSTEEIRRRAEAQLLTQTIHVQQQQIQALASSGNRPAKNSSKKGKAGRGKDDLRSAIVAEVGKAFKNGKRSSGEIAEHLAAGGIKTPRPWQKKGCPERFTDAMRIPRWKKECQKRISLWKAAFQKNSI